MQVGTRRRKSKADGRDGGFIAHEAQIRYPELHGMVSYSFAPVIIAVDESRIHYLSPVSYIRQVRSRSGRKMGTSSQRSLLRPWLWAWTLAIWLNSTRIVSNSALIRLRLREVVIGAAY